MVLGSHEGIRGECDEVEEGGAAELGRDGGEEWNSPVLV